MIRRALVRARRGQRFTFISVTAQLLAISGDPELVIALFTLDLLVVYGLIAYGGRLSAAGP